MWIYVPDDEGREAWTGNISRGEASKTRWRFELIRHVEGLADQYGTTPFDNQQPVIGLLDYQTRCTVVRPLVTHVDPGSVGALINFYRTRIEGEFEALLTGLAIRDPSENLFLGLKFTSEAFTTWYAPPVHRHSYNFATRTPELSVRADKIDKFSIPGFGTVECTTGARFSGDGVHSTSIKSSSLFSLKFDAPKSLDETQRICFGLERLFGFLIGHRGALPEFSIWLEKQYQMGDHKLHYSGTLEIGGTYYVDEKPPHPMRCIHLASFDSTSLEMIVGNFLNGQNDIITRIHAVEFCRFFTTNLNDRFSVVMPVLEEYIKKKYKRDDELTYMQHRDKFFAYIDESDDEDIKGFSRKHLSVKNEKAPSLGTLIERAILHLNVKGFVIPVELAKRIQERRGKVFHSSPSMTADDVGRFSTEITTAVAILLFHTFEDLGIDPAILADRYSALSDMAFLMKKPTALKKDPNASTRTPAEVVKQMNDGHHANGDSSREADQSEGGSFDPAPRHLGAKLWSLLNVYLRGVVRHGGYDDRD